MAWIKTLPCAACGRAGHPDPAASQVEAAHTNVFGPRGLSQRAPARSCIPLCGPFAGGCHREAKHSYHTLGEPAFCALFGIDLAALVRRLNSCWELLCQSERGAPRATS